MSLNIKNYPCLLLFLFALIILASCKGRKPGTEYEIRARTPVTVVEPGFKDIRETLEYPAITEFLVKSTIRSSITGTVEKVAVRQGDKVKKGALLFILKTREASALQNTERMDSIPGFNGTVSIFSSNEGIVSTISHQAGDFIQEGDDLVMISDPGSLVFLLEVPYEFAELIEKNKSCALTLPDNTVIKGNISGKLPEMNIQNQTVRYIVNPQISESLPENLIASAVITKRIKKGAVVVPKAALLGNETLNEFWVMKVINDSTAIRISVSKGIETDNEVEIADPVFLPSDRVILTGNYGLPDTASIIIERK